MASNDQAVDSTARTGATPQLFRQLLGAFPTGVTVITTLDRTGRPIGMTVSSVSSVSLAPPLLSICIHRDARMHDLLPREHPFCLNVLSADQRSLSERFAIATVPFGEVPHIADEHGIPLIEGAAAHIRCRVTDSHEAGDHTVFFALVEDGSVAERLPLIHHRSRYTTTTD